MDNITYYNVKIRGYKRDSNQVLIERVVSMPSNHAIEITQNKDLAIAWLVADRDHNEGAELVSKIGRVFVMIDAPKPIEMALYIADEERLAA